MSAYCPRHAPSPASLNNLAVARQEAGDVDAAIDLLRQALRIDPGYLQARWNLSLALLLRGHTPGRARAEDLSVGAELFEGRWRGRSAGVRGGGMFGGL